MKLDELYSGDRSAMDEEERDNSRGRHRPGTWGRSRGAIFLIDRASRKVLWSEYKQPRNTGPSELDRLAEYLAKRLRKTAGALPPAKSDTPPPVPLSEP